MRRPVEARYAAGKSIKRYLGAESKSEEAERKAAAEAAAKEAAEKKRLEDKNIPKEVKGRFPGETRQCRPPMPKQCNSPKWRRLIPDCKCWYPNG